jgi:hypothetical protein
METIIETFRIKGRGVVAIFVLEHPIDRDVRVCRRSDGAIWTVTGVECSGRLPRVGEAAAVLFEYSGADPQVGDKLDRL